MGVASLIQHAFNGGEFSPLMLGRQDLEQYTKALYTCYNAQVLTQGGWTRRPGSLFLWPTKFSGAKKSRLVPFKYSVGVSYLIEIGDLYARFYSSHGLLTGTALPITGITNANPAVFTVTGSAPANGTRLIVSGIVGMTQFNNVEVEVASSSGSTFAAKDAFGSNINSTAFGTYTSGGTASPIVELTMPYADTDVGDLTWCQSANELYLFHPNFPPQLLTRTSALAFAVGPLVFTDGPYENVNNSNNPATGNITFTTNNVTTLTVSSIGDGSGPGVGSGATQVPATSCTGPGASVTVTASAVTGINNDQGFLATDVGRLIRVGSNPGDAAVLWGWGEITSVTSTTVVVVTFYNAVVTEATTNWALGCYSATTGYPICGTFYQDRLGMAGNANDPQQFNLSVSDQFSNFAPTAFDGTVADSNAIYFNLYSSDINSINWIQNHYQGLIAGTESGAWVVAPSTATGALTPSNVSAQLANGYGSAAVQPFLIDRSIVYIERGARKLRELSYQIMVQGFEAADLTLLAPHISTNDFIEMQFQSEPTPTLWFTRADGVLVGFTYLRSNNVTGWHRHELAGVSDNTGGIAVVENICTIPTADGSEDELYITVLRYINGQQVRYNEVLTKVWEDGDDQATALYGDCGTLVTADPATTAVNGLNWLEGENVGVLVDGKAHPTCTVTGGAITLQIAGSLISIGETYTSIGETMPIEGGAQDGSAQGKLKRIRRLGLWLLDTLGLSYGPNDGVTPLTPILNRQWGDNFGEAVPLFTGIFRDRFEGDWDRLGQVYWQADGMFPATVVAAMTQFEVSDQT